MDRRNPATSTRRRNRVRAVLAAAGVAALGLATAAPAQAACLGADAHAESVSEQQLEATIVCLINERRAAAGLGFVRAENRLRLAGLGHAGEMVAQGYFAHDSSGGSSFIERITRTGYTRGSTSWLVGENLAWGTGSASTPTTLVQSWMDSPPHRENILRSRFREVGVAAVRGTPVEAGDTSGITVASEYGYKAQKRKKFKVKRSRAKKRQRRR
jgi:uncharacterized protein YkwD